MRKILFIVTLFPVLIFSGCDVPRHIVKDITIPYESVDKIMETKFNLDGYYSIEEIYQAPKFEKKNFRGKITCVVDTFYMDYLFFRDGIFTKNFFDCEPDCVKKRFKELSSDSLGMSASSFFTSYYWGIYAIVGDTIITQSINNPAPPKVWLAYEEKFLILNDTTILQLSTKPLGKQTKFDMQLWEQEEKNRKYLPAKFIPVPILPESNTWLKDEKWFWKSEEDYMLWKRNKKK